VNSIYSETFRLGILGGGQLGRMFIQEAVNYDVRVAILDPSPDAPCASICHEFMCGSFQDFDTVLAFGKNKDVITVEIEHVNVDALAELEQQGVRVFPRPSFLRMVQDKGLQKEFYAAHNIPTAPYKLIENVQQIQSGDETFRVEIAHRRL